MTVNVRLLGFVFFVFSIIYTPIAFSYEEQDSRIITFETAPSADFSAYKLKTIKRLELEKLLSYALGSTKQFTVLERDSNVLAPALEKEIGLARSQGADESNYKQLVGTDVDLLAFVKVLAFTSSKIYKPLDIPGSFRPRESVSAQIEIKILSPSGVTLYVGREEKNAHRQLASMNSQVRPKSTAASFSQVKALFSDLMNKAVADLAIKLSPMVVLRVQKVSDGVVVTINRGEKAGLKSGQELEIAEPPEIVIDPSTNKEVQVASFPLGKVKVVRVLPEQAHALVPNGMEVKVGYQVTVLQ